MPDELFLAGGKRLDVVISGHLPLYQWCRSQAYNIKCSRVEHPKMVDRVEEETADAVDCERL